MKKGLKLWSTNTGLYLEEARKLYQQGIFDYIELYVVPGTTETLSKWCTLNIPFTLHAPHFMHGVNLADSNKSSYNKTIFEEVKFFQSKLHAPYTVVHCGIGGNIDETILQLQNINIEGLTLENKPYIPAVTGMENRRCRGALFEEMQYALNRLQCNFCLDVGHAICTANYIGHSPYEYLEQFNSLSPLTYHISDNFFDSVKDRHLHFGKGTYDFSAILSIIDKNKNIAIETQKNSKTNLDDFVLDIKYLNRLALAVKPEVEYILTGISQGLGRELFNLLKDKQVVALSRRFLPEQHAYAQINKNIRLFEIDLSDIKAVIHLLDTLSVKGDIVFINNAASISPIDSVENLDTIDMIKTLTINFITPCIIVSHVAKFSQVHVINISSGASKHAIDNWSLYCSSKAGLEMFLNVASLQQNISVQNIDPGVMDTKMQQIIRQSYFANVDYFHALKDEGRLKTPEEVAKKIYNELIHKRN